MFARVRALRHLSAVACLGAIAGGSLLAGCGASSDADTAAGPGAEAASEATGSESATPSKGQGPSAGGSSSPSETVTPDDPGALEEDPDEAVVRAWAEQVARAINDGDSQLDSAAATMTDDGRSEIADFLGVYSGMTFPGPIPFTVTGHGSRKGSTVVATCLINTGFAANSRGEVEAASVVPIDFTLIDDDGPRIDSVAQGATDCTDIDVQETAW